MAEQSSQELQGCLVCGQVNAIPASVDKNCLATCFRCGSDLQLFLDAQHLKNRARVFCLASLAFLVPGLFLPLLKIQRFGFTHVTGVIRGCIDLFSTGNPSLGTILLVCSIILPLTKICCILFLCSAGTRILPSMRAHMYYFIEIAGRWGTLDVLLLAILIAVVKLGDIVQIVPGSGAIFFATGVFLSLAASASFSPRILWNSQEMP